MIAACHAAVCSSISPNWEQLLQLIFGALENLEMLDLCSGGWCVDLFAGRLAVLNKPDQMQFSPLDLGTVGTYHRPM